MAAMIQPNTFGANEEITEEAITPHDNDVLCGRGNNINQHKGNQYFRHLVKQNEVQYAASRKEEKPTFAEFIYNAIRNRSPPGRFIKQNSTTGVWSSIGKKKSIDKVRQALRENVPKIEKRLKVETSKRLEEAAKRMQADGYDANESLQILLEDTNTSVYDHAPTQSSNCMNPTGTTPSLPPLATVTTPSQWISTIHPEQQAAACYLNDMTKSILSADTPPNLHQDQFQSESHQSNNSTQWFDRSNMQSKNDLNLTGIDFNASIKTLESLDIPDDDQLNPHPHHFHDLENGARVSLRLSFLGPDPTGDARTSFQRRNSLFLPEIYDPITHSSPIREVGLQDYDTTVTPMRRSSFVLGAFAQDIKEKRQSLVAHPMKSSLTEVVEMYFEDCENNDDMLSDFPDDETVEDADVMRMSTRNSMMNRRVSMADECIISMIVEQVVNEERKGLPDFDDMSFS